MHFTLFFVVVFFSQAAINAAGFVGLLLQASRQQWGRVHYSDQMTDLPGVLYAVDMEETILICFDSRV